jgi:hypothetical protein
LFGASGTSAQVVGAHTVERRAAVAVGVVMSGVGLYLATRAISALTEQHGPPPRPLPEAVRGGRLPIERPTERLSRNETVAPIV